MNIAVCDDKLNARKDILNLVKIIIPDSCISEYKSGEELIKSEMDFDIIFLDIKMQGANGIETAKVMRMKQSKAEIIFVTGLDEYLLQAFDVRAFHYLMKPIDKTKFLCVLREVIRICDEKKELNRFISFNSEKNKTILIKTQANTEKIVINNIYYAEVNNRKVILHYKKGSIEYYAKLSNLEMEFGDSFFRCHRAYLVNLKYVIRYTTIDIEIESGSKILMAKQKYTDFVKAYLNYMKRINEEDD